MGDSSSFEYVRDETTKNFDFIVFSKADNTHDLYNAKMEMIKTLELADADPQVLMEACSKIVQADLSLSYADNTIMPGTAVYIDNPGSAEGPGFESDGRGQKLAAIKPSVDYPFFYLKDLPGGKTLLTLQKDEQTSYPVFEADVTSAISFDQKTHMISVRMEGKKDSKFNVNPDTGAIYLPGTYLPALGLRLL